MAILVNEPGHRRPFTDAVKRLRLKQSLRYADLEARCNRARSTAWFNNLVNGLSPWDVNPPNRAAFDGLCALFAVNEATLRRWIAVEWYGVETEDVSTRVARMAHGIDTLDEDAAGLLESLITRLAGEAGLRAAA